MKGEPRKGSGAQHSQESAQGGRKDTEQKEGVTKNHTAPGTATARSAKSCLVNFRQ